jgi:hypothetical protein
MLSNYLLVNKSKAIQLFEEALKSAPELKGGKIRGNRFKVKSKKKFLFGSWIEAEYYSITGDFKEEAGKTMINYKVRGNDTFAICNMMGILMSIPTFAIAFYSTKENASNDNFDNLSWVLFYLIMLTLWFIFFYRKQMLLRKEGEQVFKTFLEGLKKL